MHNNYLLQDCSNKHKRIILVVPLFTCACDCNVQSSHSVPTDPGLQVFNLKKYFNFPQSQQNLVQALVSVFVEFGSVTKIIYDVSYSSLSLRSSHLFVCFSAEKNCWICGLWCIRIWFMSYIWGYFLSFCPCWDSDSHLRGMHIECDRVRRTLTINQFEFESLKEQCAYWNPSNSSKH